MKKNDATCNPESGPKVATHTSDRNKRKVTDTSNGYSQQKLLSNRTLPITTKTTNPRIPDRFATCGGTPHDLARPTTKAVITYAARSSEHVLRNPWHVIRTDRNGTTPCDWDVSVSPPWDNRPVLIGGIIVNPTTGHIGSQDFLNKRQSAPPSVRRYASVDGNLADDRDSTAIFRKVLGRELSDSLSTKIYLRCRAYFTSNTIGTEAPDLVHLRLPAVNTLDEFNTFGNPTTRVRRLTYGYHWSAPGNIFGQATAVGMSGMR